MSVSQNYPTIAPSLNLSFALTKALDPRITFSRPTSAVYYDGQTVTKAEENLLKYSQEFDNAAWVKLYSTIVPNATTAPDGTNTADKIVEGTTSNDFHGVYQAPTIQTGTYAWSVYLKAGGRDWAAIWAYSGGNLKTWFDLANGVVGTNAGGNTATITPVGDGWYRCTIIRSSIPAGTNYVQITSADSDNNTAYVGDVTKGIFIWGAQLEQRDTVTAYQPTTTQPITNYIPTLLTAPANTARFDHNPVTGESLGLLIEEQRTNLVLRSEDFSNAIWTKGGANVTANTIVAPDGTLTSDKLVENTANSVHYVLQTLNLLASTTYTVTVYVKAGERTFIALQPLGLSDVVYYNLTTGTVATISGSPNSASITPVGNGWYRCVVSSTTSVAGLYSSYLYLASADSVPTYTGDGYSGIYIWGAQVEAGSFPTSYIKTEASQVTRSADSASMTGANFSDWYRADEFTTLVDYIGNSQNPTSANQLIFSFGPGGYSSPNSLISIINASGLVTVWNFSGVSYSVSAQPRYTFGKLAFSYDVNGTASVVNGGAVATGSSSSSIGLINSISFGKESSPIPALNGHIKKFAYYPQRLSNENLQALTS
jgi:hypothetical protein